MVKGRIAVYLTHFNRPKGLRAALASVLAQTHADLRCVVLDDGSTPRPVLDELTDDERVTLVCFPRRSAEYKRARCTLSANLNEARGLVADAEFASYLTDTTTYQPDRIERMIAGYRECAAKMRDQRLGLAWAHQSTGFNPSTDPGREVEEWGANRLRKRLEHGNFIDYASVLESVEHCGAQRWDESGSAWPHNDWLRWLAHAANGLSAARLPVYSDHKDTSGPEHMGQVFLRGGDASEFVDTKREE